MSVYKTIKRDVTALELENQQLKATIKDRDETIADKDKTIETLQKQNADQYKALTKMYKMLVTAVLGLQVSPDSINDCFKVFRKVIRVIERTQKLSVDDKYDIEKKVRAQAKRIKILTKKAKADEKERKIQNNSNTPSSQKSPYTKTSRIPQDQWKTPGRKKGSSGSSHKITCHGIR